MRCQYFMLMHSRNNAHGAAHSTFSFLCIVYRLNVEFSYIPNAQQCMRTHKCKAIAFGYVKLHLVGIYRNRTTISAQLRIRQNDL